MARRTCTICKSPRKADIEKAIALGQSVRAIADMFRESEISKSVVGRHKLAHMGIAGSTAPLAMIEVDPANGPWLAQAMTAKDRAWQRVEHLHREERWDLAIKASRDHREWMEVVGKVTGAIKRADGADADRSTKMINIFQSLPMEQIIAIAKGAAPLPEPKDES